MWSTIWKTDKQNASAERQSAETRLPKKYLLIGGALLAVALVSSGLAWYYYKNSVKSQKDVANSAGEETRSLIEQVGKLIVLPQDEQPTIATVADPEKLKDQPFFARAQKGFKVLIYTNAKKAILYDPVNHKIVEVAPLNIGETAGTQTGGITP